VRKPLRLGVVLALTVTLSGPALSQIYRTKDADGNVVFTDTPPPGGSAKQVQLQHTNTAEPVAVPPPATPEDEAVVEEVAPTQAVRITSPANDETIPMGGGNFSVVARVEPPLEKGQSLQLSLDGNPTGKLQQSGFWDLTSVDRGTHQLTVAVVDSNGQIITSSLPVTVHVMRPGLNRPGG
jgi:Domain of unknown function (DUF4124)/Bacterial Ig domain